MTTAAPGRPTAGPAQTVVTLLYLDHCPNWPLAADRLRAALARTGRTDVRIDWRPVHTLVAAAATGFAGSPTLLIDGVDPFPRPAHVDGLCCRFYPTAAGPDGAPSVEELVAALSSTEAAP